MMNLKLALDDSEETKQRTIIYNTIFGMKKNVMFKPKDIEKLLKFQNISISELTIDCILREYVDFGKLIRVSNYFMIED